MRILLAVAWVLPFALLGILVQTSVTQLMPARTVLSKGAQLYNYYCYQCHAYAGNGQTLASVYLAPKPRDFTRADTTKLTLARMQDAVKNGRPGTAMVAFSGVLSGADIDKVVRYIRQTLMAGENKSLKYHSVQNGWSNHSKYKVAFPFVTGMISLNQQTLTRKQDTGKQLFLKACQSCHDQPLSADEERLGWQKLPKYFGSVPEFDLDQVNH